jgi:hypothetical protein
MFAQYQRGFKIPYSRSNEIKHLCSLSTSPHSKMHLAKFISFTIAFLWVGFTLALPTDSAGQSRSIQDSIKVSLPFALRSCLLPASFRLHAKLPAQTLLLHKQCTRLSGSTLSFTASITARHSPTQMPVLVRTNTGNYCRRSAGFRLSKTLHFHSSNWGQQITSSTSIGLESTQIPLPLSAASTRTFIWSRGRKIHQCAVACRYSACANLQLRIATLLSIRLNETDSSLLMDG